MAINFPSATSVGEVYTDANGNTYVCTVLGPPAQWVGSGSSTSLDNTYLRKDASNDPVTGQLEITPATDTTGLVVTQPSGNTAAAMRITNEGTGNSFVVEDSASTDASPFIINSSGQVGVNTSSVPGIEMFRVLGNTSNLSGSAVAHFGRNEAVPVSGAGLSTLYFGNNGTGVGGYINCEATGTWSGSSTPAFVSIGTTGSGSTNPAPRFRIDQAGFSRIGPSTAASNIGADYPLEIISSSSAGQAAGVASYYGMVSGLNSMWNSGADNDNTVGLEWEVNTDDLSGWRPCVLHIQTSRCKGDLTNIYGAWWTYVVCIYAGGINGAALIDSGGSTGSYTITLSGTAGTWGPLSAQSVILKAALNAGSAGGSDLYITAQGWLSNFGTPVRSQRQPF